MFFNVLKGFNFRDFVSLELVQNSFKNYIKDLKPDDFYFVGILEKFDSSLMACAKLLNWQYVPKYSILNQNSSTHNDVDFVSEKQVLECLEFEINWYAQALSQAVFI